MRTLLLFFALGLTPLHALIIAGPNGAASGNITQGSLNSFTGGSGLPTFPYWGNQITVSDSSGLYLGNNGGYGWVMTAAHVVPLGVGASTITVGGTPYTVRDSVLIGNADIRLYRIGGAGGDPGLPALANILLATTTPIVGTAVLDFGRGSRVETTSNSATNSDVANSPGVDPNSFEWGSPANMRWGTNRTTVLPAWLGPPFTNANVSSGPYVTNSFFSLFDDAGSGNYLTTEEAAFAVGDSGGAAFRLSLAGNWELSGINLYINHDPSHVGEPSAAMAFGDANFYGDIATYRTAIMAAMVPEPSSALLSCAAVGLLLGKRKRAQQAR